MHCYAHHGVGPTIHSSVQIEGHKNKDDDRSLKAGGTQSICTHDGYILPLDIINGLPYLQMQPFTPEEFRTLPHVILTGATDWDPTSMDHTLSGNENWYNNIKDLDNGLIQTPFDEYGNYRHRQPVSAPAPTPPDPTIPETTTDPVDTPASADTNY